jgi:hypothetical protein
MKFLAASLLTAALLVAKIAGIAVLPDPNVDLAVPPLAEAEVIIEDTVDISAAKKSTTMSPDMEGKKTGKKGDDLETECSAGLDLGGDGGKKGSDASETESPEVSTPTSRSYL